MHFDIVANKSSILNQIQRQMLSSPTHTTQQNEAQGTINTLGQEPLTQDTLAEELLSEHHSYKQFTLKSSIFFWNLSSYIISEP
jgi:hypothetical protein